MQYVIDKFFRKTGIIADSSQRNVISRVMGIGANGVILFTLLGTVGIDTSPLLTAAGITGATIGFASRDFGANIVAGIALVGQPCFRTGKQISIGLGVNKVGGTIDHWDVRYLYLRGSRGELIQVPNNFILNSVVTLEHPQKEDLDGAWRENPSLSLDGSPNKEKQQQDTPGAAAAGTETTSGEASSNDEKFTNTKFTSSASQKVLDCEKKLWEAAAKKAQQQE